MAVCVLEWFPCCQTDLHVKGRSNYITYANDKMHVCMHTHTHHWQLTTKVKKTVWAILLLTNTGWHHHLSWLEIDMSWLNTVKSQWMFWYSPSDELGKKSGWVKLSVDRSTYTVIGKCPTAYQLISIFSDWNIDSIPVGMIDWVWQILITAKLNESAGGL